MLKEVIIMENKLKEFVKNHTDLRENGFSVHIEQETETWNRMMKTIGVKDAYFLIAEILCALYEEEYGQKFLFHERCVAGELAYHVNCYMSVLGYKGYPRPLTSYILPKKIILAHCDIVDIYEGDVKSLAQRILFQYRKGIRSCYVGSEKDPFLYAL